MKKVRIAAVVLLQVSLFVTIDLGLNLLFNLVPELPDGLGSHSILQGLFGIFGDNGWTLARFFFAFEKAAWASFGLLIVNAVLALCKGKS